MQRRDRRTITSQRVNDTESHPISIDSVRLLLYLDYTFQYPSALCTVAVLFTPSESCRSKGVPDIETGARCIADRRSEPHAFLLARTGGIVRSQGQFEVLHVRLIRGQRLLVRGTAEQVHTTTQTDTASTSTSLQSLTADLPV